MIQYRKAEDYMMNFSEWLGTRHRGWIIFGVGTLGFLISNFYRVSITVTSLDLSHDLHLNTTQLGHLSASFFYAFAFSQIPAGLALDRFGVRRVFLFLSLLGVPGTLLFALAQTFGQALWGRMLMGIGMSCNLMGLLVLLAAWFPANRFATLMGSAVGLGTVGGLLAATPLVVMNRALGWRGSFLLLALVNLGYVLLFLGLIQDRPSGRIQFRPMEKSSLKDLIQVFKFPAYWIISLATFFRYGCFTALQGLWAGPYLVKAIGLSTLQTGNALFMMGVGYMVGLPLFGRISDHWLGSRKKLIYPSLWVMALLILSLAYWPKNFNLAWVYLVFMALGLASAPGQLMYPHIKELVPDQATGTALSGINLFTMLGAAMITQLIGVLVEDKAPGSMGPESFQAAWVLCGAGLTLAGVLYLLVPDTRVSTRQDDLSSRSIQHGSIGL